MFNPTDAAELTLYVISFLDVCSLARLATCSKHLREFAYLASTWKNRFHADFPAFEMGNPVDPKMSYRLVFSKLQILKRLGAKTHQLEIYLETADFESAFLHIPLLTINIVGHGIGELNQDLALISEQANCTRINALVCMLQTNMARKYSLVDCMFITSTPIELDGRVSTCDFVEWLAQYFGYFCDENSVKKVNEWLLLQTEKYVEDMPNHFQPMEDQISRRLCGWCHSAILANSCTCFQLLPQ